MADHDHQVPDTLGTNVPLKECPDCHGMGGKIVWLSKPGTCAHPLSVFETCRRCDGHGRVVAT